MGFLPFALAAERRSAVSIMFAAAAIPMLGLVGLGIDFGFWNEANSQYALAADAAAVNAAKLAAERYVANDSNWQSVAVQNGAEWFNAQLGATQKLPTLLAGTPNVTVTRNNLTFVATVGYQGKVPTFFGNLFGVTQLGFSGESDAQITTTIYSELYLMLDNSSSMEIGATNTDIQAIQGVVPCDKSAVNSGQTYSVYGCGGYTGGLACPFTSSTAPTAGITFNPGSAPACPNLPLVNGQPQYANAPCAFACHWDSSSNDYYGAVRSAPVSPPIRLRFDLVQQATAAVLTTAQQLDIQGLNNITVGVATFNNDLTQIYPSGGEASTDIADAAKAVTNIGAWVSGNNPNTNFPQAMTTLMTKVTAAGDGSSNASPHKNLIIITDGLGDYNGGGGRFLGAFDTSYCATLKAAPWNFTIYVLYTPYYSLMNSWYVNNVKSLVEGTSPTPVAKALQTCSSDAVKDYYVASDLADIQTALSTILKSALKTSVRFTK